MIETFSSLRINFPDPYLFSFSRKWCEKY